MYRKEYLRKDGSAIPIELRAHLIRDDSGRPVGMWSIVRDISDRLAAERKLRALQVELERKVRDRTRRLRKLVGELSLAEHRERRRIAHILHEDLQQMLVAMKFQLQKVADKPDRRTLAALNARLQEELDQVIQMSRTLTTDLYPPVLSALGLRPALEWLAMDFKDRWGLVVEADVCGGLDRLGEGVKVFVFEAVRELLFNVLRHAGVEAAAVRVSRHGKRKIKVEVKDQGVGFDARKAIRATRTFGLFNIQERTRSFGGQMEVVSRPSAGTTTTLVLPRG